MTYFDNEKSDNTWIREFESVSNELDWHRDKNDRSIEVLDGNGWMFQFDNELPHFINKGNTVFIPKDTYHRLHKGNDKLIIKIEEYENDSEKT